MPAMLPVKAGVALLACGDARGDARGLSFLS